MDIVLQSVTSDLLYGNGGQDLLFGGTVDDYLNTRSGAFDRLNGGAGADRYEYVGTKKDDRINVGTLNTAAPNIAVLDRVNAKGRVVQPQRITFDADDLIEMLAGDGNDQIEIATDRALLGLLDGEDGFDACLAPDN